MRKPVLAGVSALLLGTLAILPACQVTSPSATPVQKVECLGSFLMGLFDGASLIGEHPDEGKVVFTVVHAGVDITRSCYPVFADSSGNAVGATFPHVAALQTSLLQPPAVSTTRLADTCPTYATGTCSDSTPGFQPLKMTWESSATADAAMTNCSTKSVTGKYAYNIPAEMVVGTDTQQKTFIEPITQIPSGDPRYDTLPPSADVNLDFSAIAQSLYDQDHISQYFNPPGQYSDSFSVTIPPKMKAHLTIHLLLEYRYGTAVATSGAHKNGWLWMYTYTFTYDTVNYPNNTYLQQTDEVATC